MKVLFITHYADLYGANLSLLGLAKEFRDQYNLDITVICPKRGPFIDRAREQGIKVIRIRYVSWQTDKLFIVKKIARKILNPLLFEAIYREVKKFNPQIIHSNSSITDLGADLADKMGVPHVWHIREFANEHYRLKYLEGRETVVRKYENADKIITVSDALNEHFRKQFPNTSIKTIYNGISMKNIQKEGEHRGTNFCYIGCLSSGKRQMDSLMATQELVSRGIKNFHMYYVGDGMKDYVQEMKKYVAQNQLEEYVTFCGYQKNIEDILSKMDVGILSSIQEAFGRATVEYMMTGLCVLATRSGANQELVTENETGFLYDVGDVKKLAELMEYCIQNKDVIKEYGVRGKEIAFTRYDQRICTKNVYDVYQTLGVNR